MVTVFARLAAATVVAIGLAAAAAQEPQRPLALADVLSLETASDPRISPDGRVIVYRRAVGGEARLWIMDADGAQARPWEQGWSARWSPSGDRIAFVNTVEGRPEIFLKAPLGEGEARRLTDDKWAHGDLTWSPDGRRLAFTAVVPDDHDPWPITLPEPPAGRDWGAPPAVIDDLLFRTPSGEFRSGFRHIFVVDVETGETRQLTHGRWDVGARFSGVSFAGGIAWAADGAAIYFDGGVRDDDVEAALSSAIFVVDVAGGDVRQVTREPGFWRAPRVSPDGRHLAYTGRRASRAAFPPQELRVMALDGGGERVLLADAPDRIYAMEWTRDGDAVVAALNHEGTTNLHRFGLDGEVRRLSEGGHRIFFSSLAQEAAVGVVVDPRRPSDVARIDLNAGGVERVTALNSGLQRIALGEVEDFWVTSPDGARVQAWLVKPPDFSPERRYPLILDIHGGPDAMGGFEFDFRHHDFASRGYLVLHMNPRGSAGYGAAFANAIQGGFPGELDAADLEAGVDALVARGYVDAGRIYAMGCSAGGAMTAWLTARSARFAAAAVMCPVVDWIGLAGTTDATVWAHTRFEQPFWEAPDAWLAHSPLMRAGRIDTPTLLVTGARDGRTPPGQAAALYLALKMRGVPTRMLVFPNGGHGPWRGSSGDLMRLQLYLDDWFSTHAGAGDGENP